MTNSKTNWYLLVRTLQPFPPVSLPLLDNWQLPRTEPHLCARKSTGPTCYSVEALACQPTNWRYLAPSSLSRPHLPHSSLCSCYEESALTFSSFSPLLSWGCLIVCLVCLNTLQVLDRWGHSALFPSGDCLLPWGKCFSPLQRLLSVIHPLAQQWLPLC